MLNQIKIVSPKMGMTMFENKFAFVYTISILCSWTQGHCDEVTVITAQELNNAAVVLTTTNC